MKIVLIFSFIVFFGCSHNSKNAFHIIDKPLDFGKTRIALTKDYIKAHYGFDVKNIQIIPRTIVLHWSEIGSLEKTFNILSPEKLVSKRKEILKASALNVSAQFIIDRDGKIYRLMPENWMARHVIGLNYSSIGVENIGGVNEIDDLTPEQLVSNVALIRYLTDRYPTIDRLIGHLEYLQLEGSKLWLELDKNYRTDKTDPSADFMRRVRAQVEDLKLKSVGI